VSCVDHISHTRATHTFTHATARMVCITQCATRESRSQTCSERPGCTSTLFASLVRGAVGEKTSHIQRMHSITGAVQHQI